MKNFKFTTTFSSIIKSVIPEEKDKYLAIASLGRNGTAQVADLINHMGGIPVRNFSGGQVVDPTKETLKMGGDFIREQNIEIKLADQLRNSKIVAAHIETAQF